MLCAKGAQGLHVNLYWEINLHSGLRQFRYVLIYTEKLKEIVNLLTLNTLSLPIWSVWHKSWILFYKPSHLNAVWFSVFLNINNNKIHYLKIKQTSFWNKENPSTGNAWTLNINVLNTNLADRISECWGTWHWKKNDINPCLIFTVLG
jgi:hypothetical protein